jgi:hypothetical protein
MQPGLLLEHTFRLFKQVLGWTCPQTPTPEAADRWTWLIIAAHTQLRLARPLAEDLRKPWNALPLHADSPPPGSAGISGTSARRPPARPVRRNPANPAQDGHPVPSTAGPHSATTSARPPNENSLARRTESRKVKSQA